MYFYPCFYNHCKRVCYNSKLFEMAMKAYIRYHQLTVGKRSSAEERSVFGSASSFVCRGRWWCERV